jgi:hypothetical protein
MGESKISICCTASTALDEQISDDRASENLVLAEFAPLFSFG